MRSDNLAISTTIESQGSTVTEQKSTVKNFPALRNSQDCLLFALFRYLVWQCMTPFSDKSNLNFVISKLFESSRLTTNLKIPREIEVVALRGIRMPRQNYAAKTCTNLYWHGPRCEKNPNQKLIPKKTRNGKVYISSKSKDMVTYPKFWTVGYPRPEPALPNMNTSSDLRVSYSQGRFASGVRECDASVYMRCEWVRSD